MALPGPQEPAATDNECRGLQVSFPVREERTSHISNLIHLHICSARAGAVTERAPIGASLVMLAEVASLLEGYFMCSIHVNPTEGFLYLRLAACLPICLLHALLHPFSLRRASTHGYKSGVSGRPCCVFCTCACFPGSRSEHFDVCVRTGEMQNGQHNNSCCSLL